MSLKTAGQGQISPALERRLAKLDGDEAVRRVALALEDLKLALKKVEEEGQQIVKDAAVDLSDENAMKLATSMGLQAGMKGSIDYVRDALMDVWEDER